MITTIESNERSRNDSGFGQSAGTLKCQVRTIGTLEAGDNVGSSLIMRILIADDDRATLLALETLLQREGHKVVGVAHTGEELVGQAELLKPDVIITDLVMPGMSGFDAAEQIYEANPVPIIIHSVLADPELAAKGFEHNAVAYLTKPVSVDQLRVALITAIKQHEQRRSAEGEIAELKTALDERKLIERAKGILMKKFRGDEESAFQKLRKLARDRGRKIVEIARTVIDSDDLEL